MAGPCTGGDVGASHPSPQAQAGRGSAWYNTLYLLVKHMVFFVIYRRPAHVKITSTVPPYSGHRNVILRYRLHTVNPVERPDLTTFS
jgi:hypothetical protein